MTYAHYSTTGTHQSVWMETLVNGKNQTVRRDTIVSLIYIKGSEWTIIPMDDITQHLGRM